MVGGRAPATTSALAHQTPSPTGPREVEARDMLVGVQGLRVLAACMIAFHHFQHEAAAIAGAAGAAFAPHDLLPWASGVDIFFVISGFIMVYASDKLFAAPHGARTFLIRRVTRLVPLYWLATTAFLIVAAVAPSALNSAPPGALHVVASYLFIPFTAPDGIVVPVYSLGWTLNFEMFFYVIFALFIAWPRNWAVLAVAATLCALVGAGMLMRLDLAPLLFWSGPMLLEFVAGMVIGLARLNGLRLPGWTALPLVLAGLGLLHVGTTDLAAATQLPGVPAWGIPATLLVMAATLPRALVHRPATLKPVIRLGDASYAIYLIHPFVARLLHQAWVAADLGAGAAIYVFVFICLAATVVVSLLVYELVERPLTRLLRHLAPAPKTRG